MRATCRTVKSELATFFDVFPNGTIWANTIDGHGYDMVFMGQAEPLKINLDEVQQRLNRPDYAPVAQSLARNWDCLADGFAGDIRGQETDLAPWLAGAEINRDGDLRLQYLAGWGINSDMQDPIYRQIMAYRSVPSNLFEGSPQYLNALLYALSFERRAGQQ